MKGCIKVLKDQPPNSVEGLLNALRYAHIEIFLFLHSLYCDFSCSLAATTFSTLWSQPWLKARLSSHAENGMMLAAVHEQRTARWLILCSPVEDSVSCARFGLGVEASPKKADYMGHLVLLTVSLIFASSPSAHRCSGWRDFTSVSLSLHRGPRQAWGHSHAQDARFSCSGYKFNLTEAEDVSSDGN